MAGEVRGVWVLRTDPTTHSLRLAEGGNWKAAGRLEHPVDSFPRPLAWAYAPRQGPQILCPQMR